MRRMEQWVDAAAGKLNWAAAAAVVAIMLLTVADIVLRRFRMPIPGTYEMVGFLGSLVVAFSMAYTAAERGHISVDLFVQKLPKGGKAFLQCILSLAGALFFALMAWAGMDAAADVRQSGEVSLTLEMPIHPFMYGMAAGCATLAVVLLKDFFDALHRVAKR